MMAVNLLTSTCQTITKKISEGMDRPLTLRERLQINVHLMFCDFCRRYRQQLLTIRDALQKQSQKIADEKDEIGLSTAAREKIKLAITKRKSGS